MKILVHFLIIVILVGLFFLNCDSTNPQTIKGSGNLVTIEKDFADFTEIEMGYAFQSTIYYGSNYSTRLIVDENIVPYLRVTQIGTKISLMLEEGNSYNDVTLLVEITLPNFSDLKLSGASFAAISGFESGRDFFAVLAGASIINGSITTGNISLILSGASNLSLEGMGKDLEIEASGASLIQLGNYPCTNVNVGLSGASRSTINTDGILNATLSGASSLYYYGNPTLGNLNISGASTIQGL